MIEILVIALCLVINGLLAAFEMAFVSVKRPELRGLARGGDPGGRKLMKLRENPERTLSIIQVGITLVGTVAAAVGGAGASEEIAPLFTQSLHLSKESAEVMAVILVVAPITFLNVVLGELVPKTLAL